MEPNSRHSSLAPFSQQLEAELPDGADASNKPPLELLDDLPTDLIFQIVWPHLRPWTQHQLRLSSRALRHVGASKIRCVLEGDGSDTHASVASACPVLAARSALHSLDIQMAGGPEAQLTAAEKLRVASASHIHSLNCTSQPEAIEPSLRFASTTCPALGHLSLNLRWKQPPLATEQRHRGATPALPLTSCRLQISMPDTSSFLDEGRKAAWWSNAAPILVSAASNLRQLIKLSLWIDSTMDLSVLAPISSQLTDLVVHIHGEPLLGYHSKACSEARASPPALLAACSHSLCHLTVTPPTFGWANLAQYPPMPRLQSLALTGCGLPSFSAADQATFWSLPSLTSLSCSAPGAAQLLSMGGEQQ